MGFRGFRGGVTFEEELSINPAKLYKSLWDAVFKRGSAELVVGEDVRIVARERSGIAVVYVDGKKLECYAIVLTAGSWTGVLCNQLGYVQMLLYASGLPVVV